MFMTAGSCSVMLLWPTRRTFCCQGWVPESRGARRGGRGISFGAGPLMAATSSAEGAGGGIESIKRGRQCKRCCTGFEKCAAIEHQEFHRILSVGSVIASRNDVASLVGGNGDKKTSRWMSLYSSGGSEDGHIGSSRVSMHSFLSGHKRMCAHHEAKRVALAARALPVVVRFKSVGDRTTSAASSSL